MTSEQYLIARGWVLDRWRGPCCVLWLDRWAQPLDDQAGLPTEEAVAIQVRRDLDCAEFVSTYHADVDREPEEGPDR